MRRHLAALALSGALGVCAACASQPPVEPQAQGPSEPERPFIKLAKREMALLLAWRGSPPSEGDQETLERLLVERLRSTYRVPIESHRENGAYTGLSPELFFGFVERGVDDVVVVEAEQLGPSEARLRGTVLIVVLDDQRVTHRLRIDQTSGKAGEGPARRFADLAYLQISRSWTDPGAEPELDALRAADGLAEKGACDHAVRIYERVFATQKPQTVVDIQRYADAERRYEGCQRKVSNRDAVQKDKGAVFRLSIEQAGVPDSVKKAFAEALPRSGLEQKLKGHTDKPAKLEILPGILTMTMRYHPDRYEAATKGQSPFFGGQPAVWIEPFLPPMQLLAELRERALERMPSNERLSMSRTQLTLRLEKVLGDYVELDFAELDGRALVLDEARVKVGGRAEVVVRSAVPKVAQNGAFVLGPLENAAGETTPFGLVYRFFELKGPPPAR